MPYRWFRTKKFDHKVSEALLARAGLCLALALISLPAHAENKPAPAKGSNPFAIQQIHNGSWEEVAEKKPETQEEMEKRLAEEARNDLNDGGAPIVVIEQGQANISTFTGQGRLSNVLQTGAIISPAAADTPSISIDASSTLPIVSQTGGAAGSAPIVATGQ